MFSFNNSSTQGTYSMRPKKNINSKSIGYININNNNYNDGNDVLNVNLNTINLEKTAVELALNVLNLKHNVYNEMSQYDMIVYYNDRIKFTNNINSILALKIILKSKFNESNGESINNNTINNNPIHIQIPVNEPTQPISNNNFKILQTDTNPHIINKPDIIYKNNLPIITSQPLQQQMPLINKPKIKSPEINTNNHINSYSQSIPQIPIYNMNNQNPIINFNSNLKPESSEFDIDAIINSYSQKKTQGFIK